MLVALCQLYDTTDVSVCGESHNVILPSHMHLIFLRLHYSGLGKRVGFCFLIEINEKAEGLFVNV